MAVKIETKNGIATALIEGDIDHHTAKDIREKIDAYLEETQIKKLNLDFSGVQFMDSSGVGLIMGRYRLMQLFNGTLKVINMPNHIERLIKLSGLGALGILAIEN